MTIPKEAISKADFDRQERGLPPRAKPKIIKPEPTKPVVSDEITFKDIPAGEIYDLSAKSCTFKNSEGTRFTGYNVFLESRDGNVVEGWMPEGQFQKLKQRIQVEKPELLKKIGL